MTSLPPSWLGDRIVSPYAGAQTYTSELSATSAVINGRGQNECGQVDALRRGGEIEVVVEKASGIGTRPELDTLVARLITGESLVVIEVSRLGRTTTSVLLLAEQLERRGIHVRILNLGIDTATPTGGLVLTMMAGLAKFERELLRHRMCRLPAPKSHRQGRRQAHFDEFLGTAGAWKASCATCLPNWHCVPAGTLPPRRPSCGTRSKRNVACRSVRRRSFAKNGIGALDGREPWSPAWRSSGFPEPGEEAAGQLLDGNERLVAPRLIRMEVSRAIIRWFRAGNLTEKSAREGTQAWNAMLEGGVTFSCSPISTSLMMPSKWRSLPGTRWPTACIWRSSNEWTRPSSPLKDRCKKRGVRAYGRITLLPGTGKY